MNQLLSQVAKAHRRLLIEQFLQRLVWMLFAALVVAAAAVAVPRVVAIEALPTWWDRAWLAGAAGASFAAALLWTAFSHRTALEAAMEIDGRFGLRERVASSMSLAADELETPAGQALLHDTVRRIERIEVSEKFRPRVARGSWLPLVPAAVALSLAMLVSPRVATSSVEPPPLATSPDQIKKSSEELAKKLVQKREQAEQQGLKDAADIFKQIEKGSDELAKNDKVDRKQAALKLNDLAQQLEQRKNQLGGRDELEKQLNSMKDFGQGPAEKIASAVKQGDWSKAVDELNKLKEQVASGELSDEKKEQLQQQLDKMQNKLAEAAQAHSDAMQDMKEQIDQQKQNGDLAKAAELQQQIDKLAAQKPQMDNLQQLADKLGQCQDCMQQGDAEGAAQSLDQLADQLGQMQQELGEMEMLDEALEQIEAAKQAMDCGECNGAGCEACQGQGGAPGQKPGDGQGQKNEGQDQQGGQGPGIGTGRGNAAPGQGDDTTATRDSRVRQKPGQGAAVFGGLVEGPNVRGASNLAEQEVGGQLNAEPADPLTAERLSRPRREHAEEYFDKLREEL